MKCFFLGDGSERDTQDVLQMIRQVRYVKHNLFFMVTAQDETRRKQNKKNLLILQP